MKTMVYIKMDASDQLLLSEGVCRQLGIVMYHPSLHQPDQVAIPIHSRVCQPVTSTKRTTLVLRVHVSLAQSLKLLPGQSVIVPVRVEGEFDTTRQTMFM